MSAAAPTLDRATFLRPIAHRGLHHASKGLIENTAPAFTAAINHGYGIECDLRPLACGTPVVFHDETLTRLVTVSRPRAPQPGQYEETFVSSLTPASLAHLSYRGSTTPILTFSALLDLVSGAVPLLVEIKSEWAPPDPAFMSKIAVLANAYQGPIALMSFDPAVIAVMQTIAPAIPRGLVSGSYLATTGDHWWSDKLTPARAATLRDLSGFTTLGCTFAAYECAALPTPRTRALRSSGIPLFTWTVRTPSDLAHASAYADAPIFEGFLPITN